MTTPDLAVLLLSTTGSAAFLLAGVSAGRLLSSKAAPHDATQLDAERNQRAQLQGELTGIRAELATALEREQLATQAAEAEKRRADTAAQRAGELGEQVARLQAQQPPAVSEQSPREAELVEEVRRLRTLLDNRPQADSIPDAATVTKATEDIQRQLDRSNRDLSKARQELATERSTRIRREGELGKLKDQVESLEKELEKYKLEEETQVGGPVATEAIRELARLQKELKQTKEALEKEQARAKAPSTAQPKPHADAGELAELKKRLDEVTSEKEDLEVRQEASAAYVRRAQEQAKQQKAEVERLQKELEAVQAGSDATEQLKQALGRGRESAAQLVKLKQELAQAKHDAKTSEDTRERIEQLEKELSQVRSSAASQTEQLRKQLAERNKDLDAAKAKLAAARAAETRQTPSPRPKVPAPDDTTTRELKVRLGQAETRAALVQTLEEENRKLKDELDDLKPRALEVPTLRDRVAKLEARLFALGEKSSPSVAPPPIDAEAYPTPAATQNTLRSLLDPKTTRAVVLADSHGLPVGAEGDNEIHEGLAAVTGLAGHLAEQAAQILPLSAVSSIAFSDQNDLIVSCYLFDCQGDGMALATLGTATPAKNAVDRVIAGVVSALGPSAT